VGIQNLDSEEDLQMKIIYIRKYVTQEKIAFFAMNGYIFVSVVGKMSSKDGTVLLILLADAVPMNRNERKIFSGFIFIATERRERPWHRIYGK
jgi:hypothetical protein